MNLASKFLAAGAALLLLAACETPPTDTGSATGTGTGAAGGEGMGMDSSSMGSESMSYLPGTDIPDRVFFDYDQSAIRGDAESTLQRQAEWLKGNGKKVVIEGHCDERGTREYNIALGERRANAVKRYLVSQGVSAGNISTISYGKERPAVVGSNEDAWAQNRRGVTVLQ